MRLVSSTFPRALCWLCEQGVARESFRSAGSTSTVAKAESLGDGVSRPVHPAMGSSRQVPQLSETASLGDVLRCQAQDRPNQVAFTFLCDGESEAGQLTYRELDHQARSIAAALVEHDVRGKPVLLLYPSGLEYVAALFGCFYAGAIAVPAYPPRPGRRDPRIANIVQNSGAALALTTSRLLPALAAGLSEAAVPGALEWLPTDCVSDDGARAWQRVDLGDLTPALLQYTSGSTSVPRGAIVTHGNLVHNQRMIETAFVHSETSTHVSWLPIFHDMGLANVLNPVFVGASAVLMPPLAFIQRPVRWLRAISRYRGATAMAPNFAYDLCVQTVTDNDRAGLDLSSWSLALNGAEPVRRGTLERFARAFAPCGFRREAFFPAYGLAEATVFVTGGPKGHAPKVCTVSARALERHRVVPAPAGDAQSSRDLIACGRAWLDEQITIVDPTTMRKCPPDVVGEIWIAGPHVGMGYWGCPAAADDTFSGRISDTNEGPFLKTGDLGFMIGEQLYITGRLKNVIIIDGRNCYAEDIELAAEQSHPAVRAGHCAAFAVDVDDQERLVIVAEIERHTRLKLHAVGPARDSTRGSALLTEEITSAVRRAIAETHDVAVYRVVPVRAGTIPKTSSGKLQRQLCQKAFEAGTLSRWHDDVA